MNSVRVSVQARAADLASLPALAVEVEQGGFDTLYVADHPGVTPAPFVALAAAASVTEHLQLGTCVLNAGMWEPLQLAIQAATLDVVTAGRVVLGVGAGHTPHEWTATGRPFPSGRERVERMIELIDATQRLLAGETVSQQGRHFTLDDVALAEPRPVQNPVPLLVGGNGISVLRFAAQRADIIGVTGLGRTLADGHRHEVDWSRPALDRIADLVDAGAGRRRRPHIEALVQHVEITDDAPSAAERIAPAIAGASIDDLLDTPFVWLGTEREISETSPRAIRPRTAFVRGSRNDLIIIVPSRVEGERRCGGAGGTLPFG